MAWQPAIADILAVQNTIANYCIYLDNKDFDALATVFNGDEAVTDYRAIAGGAESALIKGNNKVVEWLDERVKGKLTQHATSTQKLEFTASHSCSATTYFTANTFFSMPQAEGTDVASPMLHVSLFGCYQDVLIRINKEWKIHKRVVKMHVRQSTYTPSSLDRELFFFKPWNRTHRLCACASTDTYNYQPIEICRRAKD
jgi:hypothetical protein